MISHSRVIDVVRQTGNELVAIGDGRNLDQGQGAGNDEIAQKGDVQIKCGNAGKGGRLPKGEKMTNLGKKVVTDPNNFLPAGSQFDGCGLTAVFL